MSTAKPFRSTTITNAKLRRMESDISWATSGYAANNGADVIDHFGYDHGNMLITNKNGKTDLLFEHNGDSLRSNACRILYNLNPDMTRELIRGYQLARAAGLLGDGMVNEAYAKGMISRCVCQFPSDIQSGLVAISEQRDILRQENKKPGGIPFINEDTL